MPAVTLHVVVQEEDVTDDALPLLRTRSPRARVLGQSHMQSYGNRH